LVCYLNNEEEKVEIYLLNGDVIPLSPAQECAKQIYYYSFFFNYYYSLHIYLSNYFLQIGVVFLFATRRM
jgi:hypothetical protein